MNLKIVFFALLISLFSCSQSKQGDEITLMLRTTKSTNRGTPLYVVIKETNMTEFLTQDYQEIAAQMSVQDDGKESLIKQVIVPGKSNTISIPLPGKDKSIGIYFLYTSPGECWKYILQKPSAQKVKILLGEKEFTAANVFEQ